MGIWGEAELLLAKKNTFRERRKIFSGIWGDQCIIFRDRWSTDPPPLGASFKGTFLSLVHSGVLHQDNLHPLTCIKIYNFVVLPKALYGCENWFDLTESEILSLERTHRFCVKHMQSLSKRTRTDEALRLLGVFPIALEITLVNVNAPVVATTNWWLHFSAQVVVLKVKKSIPVDFMIHL